jgi:hypothetical protein
MGGRIDPQPAACNQRLLFPKSTVPASLPCIPPAFREVGTTADIRRAEQSNANTGLAALPDEEESDHVH